MKQERRVVRERRSVRFQRPVSPTLREGAGVSCADSTRRRRIGGKLALTVAVGQPRAIVEALTFQGRSASFPRVGLSERGLRMSYALEQIVDGHVRVKGRGALADGTVGSRLS